MSKSGPPSEENQAPGSNSRKGKGRKFLYKKNRELRPTSD
jgi:hypothetical protein